MGGLRLDAAAMERDCEYSCECCTLRAGATDEERVCWALIGCKARRRGDAVVVQRACRAYPSVRHMAEAPVAAGSELLRAHVRA